MKQFEGTGEKFNLKTFLEARQRCIQTINQITKEIKIGMNEKDIKTLSEARFKEIGVSKFWHPIKIRISSDTTKTFRDISDPEIRCQKGDLCFLDLGPIIQEHEADYGRTFLVESDGKNALIEASHEVFDRSAEAWRKEGLSGVALFNFADRLAQKYGFNLNPQMSGHRLGDFPHRIHSTQDLFEWDQTPSAHLWVLEIHLIDPNTNRGAFFEDLLM